MYRQFLDLDNNDPMKKKYITYRNIYNKLKRAAKAKYYADRLNKFKNDTKKIWSVINDILEKYKNK